MLEAASAEPAEPLLLVEAYDLVLAKARDLSADGWLVHGQELIPRIAHLDLRADEANTVEKIDSATFTDGSEAGDEAILEALGGGEVFRMDGERFYRPAVLVELRERREELRRLEAEAGLVVIYEEDGQARFTTVPQP